MNIQQSVHTEQMTMGFFDPRDPPTVEEIREEVSAENPECPLSKFKGNTPAMRRVVRACRAACLDHQHRFTQSFAFLGPASTGKTTLVKLMGETVELPTCIIQPKAVKTLLDVLEKINETCNNAGLPLVPVGSKIKLPACIVFIDEVHSLSNSIVQGLLTATEANDGMMDTGDWLVDCSKVCWIVATTDRGLLFDAFDTRFTKIHLEPYTQGEVAEIIRSKNPTWPLSVCVSVAKYAGRIAREALDFAEEMKTEIVTTTDPLEVVVETIRKDHQIDEHGLSVQRLKILVALSESGPISKDRMTMIAGCKSEELEKFIMPVMLMTSPDQPAMVRVTARGYDITAAGLAQLDLRGIKHGIERTD